MSFTAKILLLGSGELGRECVISAKRLGADVDACDSCAGAPAMQVADACAVFPTLDGAALRAAVNRRMGVALARAGTVERARALAADAAAAVRIVYSPPGSSSAAASLASSGAAGPATGSASAGASSTG